MMVTREAVEQRLREAVAELGFDPEDMTPDATLQSLDMDSLDLIEIVQILEQELKIEIRTEDAEGVETFGQVVDVIYARVS